MSTSEKRWDGDIAKLPKTYLSEVKKRLESQKAEGVRFGILGKGFHPNYELVFSDGRAQPMLGSNHNKYPQHKKFEEANVTRVFNLDEIKAAQLIF